jgi:hypothetical protein
MMTRTCLPTVAVDRVFGGGATLADLIKGFEAAEKRFLDALNASVGPTGTREREVMDRAMAHYWPGRDPLLKHLDELVGAETK